MDNPIKLNLVEVFLPADGLFLGHGEGGQDEPPPRRVHALHNTLVGQHLKNWFE